MLESLQEKRRSPRIKLKTPLVYQVRGAPEAYNTVSDNISLGGLGFIHHNFIPLKTTLMLKVNVLSRILSPAGRIVSAMPLAHSNRYRLGVEFLELDTQEKNYLGDYIAMQTGKL